MHVADETELFIGIVAPVGVDVEMVCAELEKELNEYEYECTSVRLSDYLAEWSAADFSRLPQDERIWEAMSAGDNLRRTWDRSDALALHAISDVYAERANRAEPSEGPPEAAQEEDQPPGLQRHAFIFRSLKTRGELETFRAVYGKRFVLIAAYSPDDSRAASLANKIKDSRKTRKDEWKHSPQALMTRDLDEQKADGQDVQGTFHQADFFVRASSQQFLEQDVIRTLEILFGHPYRTPTKDEHAQFHASGAARRSAEPGRQVGAAVVDEHGSLISLGTNEVPKFGGGSHWEDDGTGNREFELKEIDTNRKHQVEIAEKLSVAVLEAAAESTKDLAQFEDHQRESLKNAFLEVAPSALLGAGLDEITEFGRAAHAEMSALLDAARRGVSVQGATLHTTTFPCHNCVRHIVDAGIARVVFIEPYPKSKAPGLHEDAIAISSSEPGDKLPVEPFVGVAPRRYLEYFDADGRKRNGHVARKDDAGKLQKHEKKTAKPVFSDLEPDYLRPYLSSYRVKELMALDVFSELIEEHSPETDGAEP